MLDCKYLKESVKKIAKSNVKLEQFSQNMGLECKLNQNKFNSLKLESLYCFFNRRKKDRRPTRHCASSNFLTSKPARSVHGGVCEQAMESSSQTCLGRKD
jgi:hypothetical protein